MTVIKRLLGAAAAACIGAGLAAAEEQSAQNNDLRDFRVGMKVSDLPREGYGNFACVGDDGTSGISLESWEDYAECPTDAAGLREVRFEYTATRVEFVKANDKWEGTRVYGHPAIVSLLIDEGGVVDGIRIATDPEARRYMRKKAFLLGTQAKFHFSPETWQCEKLEPAGGEEPVGGIFLKERCVNRYDDRVVKLEIDLFRTPGQSMEEFVNATRLEIRGRE
jgi:hypothetical protein